MSLPPATAPRAVRIPGRRHTLTGDVCLHAGFHSEFLSADRDVLVWLPPGYRTEPARRYPVLYLQDGQNIFDGATSFAPGVEWRVDETAHRLIQLGRIEPLIIVAIANTEAHRLAEYIPPPRSDPRNPTGADLYARLLIDELKPAIDAEYRTRSGPNDTGVGGSSAGGSVSLYLGLRHPDVFGKLAILSPGVRRAGPRLLGDLAALPAKLPLRIWLDVGTLEGPLFLFGARRIRDALLAKGWRLGHDLAYLEDLGGLHNEAAWARRVWLFLRYLFPAG